MKTSIYVAFLAALLQSAGFGQSAPPSESEQPAYAIPAVVYEAPVVYQGPVLYQMPVVYLGPVYYTMPPAEPMVVCAPPEPTPSTVVVIGGEQGTYSYTHDDYCTPDLIYIGGRSSVAPTRYHFRGR